MPESEVGKDKEAEVMAGRLQRERMIVTPSRYSRNNRVGERARNTF